MNSDKIFKPSLTIANSVPLSASQHDFFNFLLQQSYIQLETNHFRDTFIFSYQEIKNFNSRLKSKKMVDDFFKDIYDKEFEFNILGKDNTIESNVKSRFITLIKKNKDNTLEIALEPLTISALRKMVLKKKNIKLTNEEQLKLNSYVQVKITKDLSFYPSKVVYELVYDFKEYMKKIDIEKFKKITDTVDKYKKNYNKMVIQKIQNDLNTKIEGFKIELIKEGRSNKWVQITSSVNLNFPAFYENWLKINEVEDSKINKQIATSTYQQIKKGSN